MGEEFERIVGSMSVSPLWARRQYLKRNSCPRFVYKYRAIDPDNEETVDRLRAIVIRSELWLTPPLEFNDPFDMGINVVVDGSLLPKLASRIRQAVDRGMPNASQGERDAKVREVESRSPEEMLRNAQTAYDEVRRWTGVCSFAGCPRSILMWTHYGQNHTGLCLQFDVSRDPRTFLQAIAVDYSEDYPHINWVDDPFPQLKTVLLRKYIGWKYENERRITIGGAARTRLRFRPPALTAIIVGCPRVGEDSRTCA